MKRYCVKSLVLGLLILIPLKASSRAQQSSFSGACSSAHADDNHLANTKRLLADANALALVSNAHPEVTADTVKKLLEKRREKLHKLNELSDNLEVLHSLEKTLSELLYKNKADIEKAERNKSYQEDDLNKMKEEHKRLRRENIILLDIDEDEFSQSSDLSSQASKNDLLSQASIESMSSEEAIIRDQRAVAKIIEPHTKSKQQIIDGFKEHLLDLDETQEKLSEKLALAEKDLNDARDEFASAEKALEDVENVALALFQSHPEALSPEVAATIKRRQEDARARKSADAAATEGSSCLLL